MKHTQARGRYHRQTRQRRAMVLEEVMDQFAQECAEVAQDFERAL